MPYNIIYVDPTEAFIVQAIKKRRLSLLNQRIENMRGYNSLFITITSKGRKQAFKKLEKIILRGRKLYLKVIYYHYMLL